MTATQNRTRAPESPVETPQSTERALTIQEQIKAYAISELMTGKSYRAVQRNLAEQFKETVGLATLNRWFTSDEQRVQAFNRQQAQNLLDSSFRIYSAAAERIIDKLEDTDPSLVELNIVAGTAADKVVSILRNNTARPQTINAGQLIIHLNSDPVIEGEVI